MAQNRRAGEASARELLTASDVARTIARIAHQIIEKTAGTENVVLVGIPTRGALLARRLGAAVAEFSGTAVPVGIVDPTLYRDDLRHHPTRPLSSTDIPDGGLDDALADHGRPRAVQLAVLVDRGHRELPIRADYVGKNVPTARDEQVKVLLSEIDGVDAVRLEQA